MTRTGAWSLRFSDRMERRAGAPTVGDAIDRTGPTRPIGPIGAALAEPRTALVTGASGFGGRHLLQALQRSAWHVAGLGRRAPAGGLPGISLPFLEVDITNVAALREAVRAVAPDYVFHLAAATPPAHDACYLAVNVGGTVALLDAVAQERPEASVLVVGSDAQYGHLGDTWLPTPEAAPMRPVNGYGRSKVLAEAAALCHPAMTGVRVVCVRPFNYIGPGQSERFVVAHIARQVAEAEAGGTVVIELGRIDAARDFTDVRDMVEAFIAALVSGRSGAVYNAGSGTARTIGSVAGALAGMAAVKVAVRSDAGRVRRGDVRITTCDAALLRTETGWAPAIPFEQTLADTLTAWRRIVSCPEASADLPNLTRRGL